MALKLFNTMGKKMEEFVPVDPNGKHVGFYGCGPTVYNYAHIGNLRAYIFLDILDKTLTYLGYDITHVMNITDVGHLTGDNDDGEDKMLKSAAERHQSVLEIAKFYTDAFMKDIDALNIRHPDVICKATEHIPEMIELIKKLEANGHTYMAGGNLYFDVSTYPNYGKLANLNLDELKAGAGRRKLSIIDENKRNPSDFVLWFTKSKFENQAMIWDSPWGAGYPGWHIECSAMSMKYLGKHIDIHTGGIDHVPVHHTNEIAQSEGSFTEEEAKEGPWVKYWLHNEFLVIEGGNKMSKSSGNFLRLQTLLDKGYSALDYRFFLLGGHYRKQIYFSWDAMNGARDGRNALNQRVAKLIQKANTTENLGLTPENFAEILSKINFESENEKRFREGLENDLATPIALSAMQKESNGKGRKASEALSAIYKMDKVLSLSVIENAFELIKNAENEEKASSDDHAGDPEAEEINALVAERTSAKKAKDFAKSDEIRNLLLARGITIIDTPTGPIWKRG
ncbi:cysteine--tRNA ligase [Treponema zioleckii]|uniref:cysteine--tRNA ligase n=1 Tax=Treponema zioleckii TaxID=331680 RepID=UPI00168A750D|nr:cysteine--tRNA ligase [Treponema zioleckii]